MHGRVKDGWLIKQGKQVVKFWKYGGYAIPVVELQQIDGVILYTQYDGTLYQTSDVILKDGIGHIFNDEVQKVLPVSGWRVKDDTSREET